MRSSLDSAPVRGTDGIRRVMRGDRQTDTKALDLHTVCAQSPRGEFRHPQSVAAYSMSLRFTYFQMREREGHKEGGKE